MDLSYGANIMYHVLYNLSHMTNSGYFQFVYFQFFMNRSCKERQKINQIGVKPYEYTGLKSQENSKSKPRERRRSTVIAKVKEISGLETFDKSLTGKLFCMLSMGLVKRN